MDDTGHRKLFREMAVIIKVGEVNRIEQAGRRSDHAA